MTDTPERPDSDEAAGEPEKERNGSESFLQLIAIDFAGR